MICRTTQFGGPNTMLFVGGGRVHEIFILPQIVPKRWFQSAPFTFVLHDEFTFTIFDCIYLAVASVKRSQVLLQHSRDKRNITQYVLSIKCCRFSVLINTECWSHMHIYSQFHSRIQVFAIFTWKFSSAIFRRHHGLQYFYKLRLEYRHQGLWHFRKFNLQYFRRYRGLWCYYMFALQWRYHQGLRCFDKFHLQLLCHNWLRRFRKFRVEYEYHQGL
jgi:hypothetical protein